MTTHTSAAQAPATNPYDDGVQQLTAVAGLCSFSVRRKQLRGRERDRRLQFRVVVEPRL